MHLPTACPGLYRQWYMAEERSPSDRMQDDLGVIRDACGKNPGIQKQDVEEGNIQVSLVQRNQFGRHLVCI